MQAQVFNRSGLAAYMTKETTKDEFYSHLKSVERVVNAGCTTEYDPAWDLTHWFIAGICQGITKGRLGCSTAYHVVI